MKDAINIVEFSLASGPVVEVLCAEELVPDVEVCHPSFWGTACIVEVKAATANVDLGQEVLWNLNLSHLRICTIDAQRFAILIGAQSRYKGKQVVQLFERKKLQKLLP